MESLHSFLFFSPEETGGGILEYSGMICVLTKCHDIFFPSLGRIRRATGSAWKLSYGMNSRIKLP